MIGSLYLPLMLIALTTRLVKFSGHHPKFFVFSTKLPLTQLSGENRLFPRSCIAFRLSSGLQAIQRVYVLCKTLNVSKTSHCLRECRDKKLQLLCERFSLKTSLTFVFACGHTRRRCSVLFALKGRCPY